MGASGNLTAASYGIQGTTSLASSYAQSTAMRSMGNYQEQAAGMNATLARLQGADAIRRGDIASSRQLTAASRMAGSQRASLAASGIAVDSGSAANIQSETKTMGALDALTIKHNAWRQAWGLESQAQQYTSQGQFEKMTADYNARSTLLTGGMNAMAFGMKGYGAWLQGQQLPKKNDPDWMEKIEGTRSSGQSYDDRVLT